MSPTCSARSLALGEELWGTAPEEPNVLVIENPGPWGRDGLADSRLHGEVADRIAATAKAGGYRIQIVRRTTRRYTAAQVHVWLGPFRGVLRRLELAGAADLLDLDLATAGEPDPEPLFLVCTHSTRDPCCARFGLPLAREVARVAPAGRVWHSAHLGGHRFAATMAVLAQGWWLGRVPLEAAPAIVAGERDPVLLRGRAGQPAAMQVAEIWAMRLGHDPGTIEPLGGDRFRVDGRALTVRLEPTGTTRPLSCGAGAKVEDPGRWIVTAAP